MFASYEIGTSCPSLTAIKRYDLDKSADVLLMDHVKKRGMTADMGPPHMRRVPLRKHIAVVIVAKVNVALHPKYH